VAEEVAPVVVVGAAAVPVAPPAVAVVAERARPEAVAVPAAAVEAVPAVPREAVAAVRGRPEAAAVVPASAVAVPAVLVEEAGRIASQPEAAECAQPAEEVAAAVHVRPVAVELRSSRPAVVPAAVAAERLSWSPTQVSLRPAYPSRLQAPLEQVSGRRQPVACLPAVACPLREGAVGHRLCPAAVVQSACC
jgi:hypothetical protein